MCDAANIKTEPYNFDDYDEDEFTKLSATLDTEEVKTTKETKKLAGAAKEHVAETKENAYKLMSEAQNFVKTRIYAAKALAEERAKKE